MNGKLKEMLVVLGIIATTLAVFGADPAASGGSEGSAGAAPQQADQGGISAMNRASMLLGKTVVDGVGKPVGKLQDLVFDLTQGRIGYAVLSLSGNRLVPVPLTALKAKGEDQLSLNMSPQILAAAPGIANDEWPAFDAFAVGGPANSEVGKGSSSEAAK